MSTLRTLVGCKIDTNMVPIQRASVENNLDWLELKSTSSIGYDLVALTRRIPEITFETNDLKSVATIMGNNIYAVKDVTFYMGTFATEPSYGYYFSGTGVATKTMENAVIIIDRISGDVGEPITVTLRVRGGDISSDSENINLEEFTLTHSEVNTISSLTVDTTTIGVRNLEIATNVEFYDHFTTNITPDLSAITTVRLEATATILIDDMLTLEALTQKKNFVFTLKKYREVQSPIDSGSITITNAIAKCESYETSIGEIATARVVIKGKDIAFNWS
ncbi:MAG: hypothetical protein QXS54_09090 [Candidatus Methanomethylicaceae archaeon]